MQKYANLVELEKCCQTHIFLQNFVLIQPRTSPLKICKILQNFAKFANFADPNRSVHERAAGSRRPRNPRMGDTGKSPHILAAVVDVLAAVVDVRGGCRNLPKICQFLANFARFRLYRHRSLQENTRFAAFFKIYQII